MRAPDIAQAFAVLALVAAVIVACVS